MMSSVPGDPAFITYLLTPDLCDCFFIVGNRDLVKPERIGVVKKMLLAHSVVLRSDMLAREMEENKDVPVSDTYPDTFKNLLRFVYGYDNTNSLDFDEADNLLYVAEKYQIESLKGCLSARLIKLLNAENICSLLNNPACYKVLELDSAITHILQSETQKVLASPQFLDLTCDALVKVVEQEAMNVPEIEVWRSVVLWAKHCYNPPNGEALRRALEKPAKHIRVCTIDGDSLVKDVFTTDIMTKDEIRMICSSKSSGKREEGLVCFSNEVECRKRTSLSRLLTFDFDTSTFGNICDFNILTESHAVELLPLSLTGKKCPFSFCPKGLTYECSSTITISRITDYSNDISSETPETITVYQQVKFEGMFSLPLLKDGKNIVLLPNNRYNVSMTFCDHVTMYGSNQSRTWVDEYISVQQCYFSQASCTYRMPIKTLHYRPLP